MKAVLTFSICFVSTLIAYAQSSATISSDTWSNMPPAADDRFSNPKSKLFAGPNGWFNFGEVRAQVSNPAKTSYHYQGGFTLTTHQFVAVETSKNRVMSLEFGTDQPAVGVYTLSSTANPAKKVAHLAFADVSNSQLKEWSSINQSGTVTVSRVHGFLYVKCRAVELQPTGLHNRGDFNHPMTLGFEGAIKPD